MKKLKLFSLALMALFSMSTWGTDLEIPLTNLKNFPLDYGLIEITNTENTTIGSNQLQSNKTTAKFKISSKVAGVYLKTISFTDANSSKNGGFTCDENESYMTKSSSVYTYTAPNTTTTEANFSLIGNGGTAKMGTIEVTISTSDQVERLSAFSGISNQIISCTSSAATSNIELSVPSSNGVSVSSSRISIGSGGKHLIVSGKNHKLIKYIAIPKYQQATYDIEWASIPAGTAADDVWAPTSSSAKSVDLTLTVSSTVYSQEVYVVYEDATTYIVSYNNGGGSGTMTDSNSPYEAGDEVTLLENTFEAPDASSAWSGWDVYKTGEPATKVPVTDGKFTMPAYNVTVAAQWATAYDVKFFQGYGEPDVQIGETQSIGEGAFAIAPADPERDGYAFMGWSFDATIANVVNVAEYPITEETNFTAIWLPLYAVTYNKGAYGSGTIEAGEKIEGIAFTLSAERFTRENYVQVGWALTDGGAQAYSLGGSYTEDADIELFPVWMEAESYTYNATAAKTIATLKSEGWEFHSDEFDADPTDTEAYVNTVDAMNTAKLTAPKTNGMDDNAIAFAKSTSAYAIYDLGEEVKIVDFSATLYGGSSSAFNETIEYLGANKSTVKKSYTNSLGAGNWQANDINKNDEVEDVRYIKIYGASKWVVMSALNIAYVPKYTISFAAGEGASGTMDAVQAYAGNNVILPACTFTAPDKKEFDAWTSTDVTITDGELTMPKKDITVTATWRTPTPTAIDNTEDEVKAVKVLRDGQIFIEKNGHVYNVFGACIK